MNLTESAFVLGVAWFLATFGLSFFLDFLKTIFELAINSTIRELPGRRLDPKEVCVVVPCHNSANDPDQNEVGQWLLELVKSVPAGYRIVFSENASTDSTLQVLNKIRNQFPERAIDVIACDQPGKMNAVHRAVLFAKGLGYRYFLLLDDDVRWTGSSILEVSHYSPACTALPVVPSEGKSWIHRSQIIEYQMMVASKRAQSLVGSASMASGAAGLFTISDFVEAMHEHDGKHIGDDTMAALIFHVRKKRIAFGSGTVIRTRPPQTLKVWWKQRAKRWEISPVKNMNWLARTGFKLPGEGPGFLTRWMFLYRLFVVFNDVLRIVSFPLILWRAPQLMLGVLGMTWVSVFAKVWMYHKFFELKHSWDRQSILMLFLYPGYAFLCWFSRLYAIPKGLVYYFKSFFDKETVHAQAQYGHLVSRSDDRVHEPSVRDR